MRGRNGARGILIFIHWLILCGSISPSRGSRCKVRYREKAILLFWARKYISNEFWVCFSHLGSRGDLGMHQEEGEHLLSPAKAWGCMRQTSARIFAIPLQRSSPQGPWLFVSLTVHLLSTTLALVTHLASQPGDCSLSPRCLLLAAMWLSLITFFEPWLFPVLNRHNDSICSPFIKFPPLQAVWEWHQWEHAPFTEKDFYF